MCISNKQGSDVYIYIRCWNYKNKFKITYTKFFIVPISLQITLNGILDAKEHNFTRFYSVKGQRIKLHSTECKFMCLSSV
jgi:hypothetical protein